MSAHKKDIKSQRVPLTLYEDDCALLINLKHKMETEADRIITVSDILRTALRELARLKNIPTS